MGEYNNEENSKYSLAKRDEVRRLQMQIVAEEIAKRVKALERTTNEYYYD